MSYTYNPTPGEAALLAQIAQRESGGNYSALYVGSANSHAAGAYQFQPGTWQEVAQATGVGMQYASAADAPAWMQDTNALYLLRQYGPNSTASWGASGPYDTSVLDSTSPVIASATQPIVDLSGAASTASSSDILSSLNTAGVDLSSVGLSSPVTNVVIAAGAAALLWMVMGRR
jgi:Transglycosylase-like domain